MRAPPRYFLSAFLIAVAALCAAPRLACGQASPDTINVTKEVRSIEFQSDYGNFYETPIGSPWADGTTLFKIPECVIGGRSDPIFHKMGTAIKVKVKVVLEPEGTSFDLVGESDDKFLSFESKDNISTGQEQDVVMTAEQELPSAVDDLYKSVTWKIKQEGDTLSSSKTQHRIYVTFDQPNVGGVRVHATEHRIRYVCNAAKNQANMASASKKVFEALPQIRYSLGKNHLNRYFFCIISRSISQNARGLRALLGPTLYYLEFQGNWSIATR